MRKKPDVTTTLWVFTLLNDYTQTEKILSELI